MLRSSPYSGFQFNLSSKVIWTAKKSFAPIDLFRVSIKTNERTVCSISADRQGIPACRRAAAAGL
jgi:hypothetical protein